MSPLGRGLARGAKLAGLQMLKGAKFAGKNIMSGVKQAAKNDMVREIAKQAVQKGTEIAASAAVDALQGRNFGEAFKERGRQMALNTLTGQNSKEMPKSTRKRKLKLKQSEGAAKRRRVASAPSPSIKRTTKRVSTAKKTRRIHSRNKVKRKYYKKGRHSRAALNRNNLF